MAARPRSSSRPRVRPERPSARLLGAALAIVIAACGPAEEGSEPPPPEAPAAAAAAHENAWQEALRAARDAEHALGQGRTEEANEAAREATRILFFAGALDDVPRQEAFATALERLAARLGRSEILALRDGAARADGGASQDGCTLLVDDRASRPCVAEGLRELLAQLRQRPRTLRPAEVERIAETLEREHRFVDASLERGARWLPTIHAELQARKLPPLLSYVAVVESGFRNEPLSTADAAGFWQFIRPTARRYGLRIDDSVDERLDPERASAAAAAYLQDLALEFGGESLLLALASYNAGEGRVRRGLRELDDPFADRSYWKLVERGLLPEETARYVERFLAAALAGERVRDTTE